MQCGVRQIPALEVSSTKEAIVRARCQYGVRRLAIRHCGYVLDVVHDEKSVDMEPELTLSPLELRTVSIEKEIKDAHHPLKAD